MARGPDKKPRVQSPQTKRRQKPKKDIKPLVRGSYAFRLDVFQAICIEIVEGALTKPACKKHGIDYFSLATWLHDEDLEEQYGLNVVLERARRARAWLHAEEVIRIADNMPDLDSANPDDRTVEDDTLRDAEGRPILDRMGREILNKEWVARSKLRMDARMWACKWMAPEVFGGKSSEAIKGLNVTLNISPSDMALVGYEHADDNPEKA